MTFFFFHLGSFGTNETLTKFWLNLRMITYFTDYAMKGHMFQSFDFHPEDWCLARCNLDQWCRSVNYNRKVSSFKTCELNSATRQQRPKSYNPRTGWVYFENKVTTSATFFIAYTLIVYKLVRNVIENTLSLLKRTALDH